MDKRLTEKYKKELSQIREKSSKEAVTTATNTVAPIENAGYGFLTAMVTSLRGIYPVKNAEVTVFTGNVGNERVYDTALTDESGKTRPFRLPTPPLSMSLNPDETALPYSRYNMRVKADGYVENVFYNIPVFSGVNSIQRSNMLLLETAGKNKGPMIFDEGQSFDL